MNKAPLQQAAAEYIEQLRIERRLAQNTIASYQRDLQDAIRYLRDEHADWQEVDQTAILAFLDQLKKQGVAQELLIVISLVCVSFISFCARRVKSIVIRWHS